MQFFKKANLSWSSLKVTKLSTFQPLDLKFFLTSLLLVVPSSSVTMERLKDGNVELCKMLVVIIVKR